MSFKEALTQSIKRSTKQTNKHSIKGKNEHTIITQQRSRDLVDEQEAVRDGVGEGARHEDGNRDVVDVIMALQKCAFRKLSM